MIRRNGVDWLTITAEGSPFGAVLNTEHITHVRWQPIINDDLKDMGSSFQVIIELVGGTAHSLSFNKESDARLEYFRIGNELRGSVVDEGVMK